MELETIRIVRMMIFFMVGLLWKMRFLGEKSFLGRMDVEANQLDQLMVPKEEVYLPTRTDLRIGL